MPIAERIPNYSWKFYLSIKDSWNAMYRDCEAAVHSIEYEQYIIEDDKIGQSFLKLFIKKAQQGVRVVVICDSFGSRSLANSPLIEKLRKAGGIFYFYQPLKYFHIFYPRRWFPRTHVKTLLIDSKIVYSGGICIALRMKNWRDTYLRITGPISLEVRKAFDYEVQKISKAHYRIDKSKNFYYLQNRPLKLLYSIYGEFTYQIRHAKNYIYISTAFFVPNKHFISLLQNAARRGVEVCIIATQHSDIYPADWVALSYLKKLFEHNIQVFLYQKSVFHCKVIVIDDKWASVGSTNMDILSFFYNREANVIIKEKTAIAELKSHFITDLNYSIELSKSFFNSIPLWKKILGFLAQILKLFFRRQY
jgi:cardiolipin synthase